MDEVIKMVLESISFGISVVASIIVIWGVVVVLKDFISIEFASKTIEEKKKTKRNLRQKLGEYLLIGLEVLIAADIIETIINPSVDEMLILAGVVIIRTFISYFLDKELNYDKA